MRKSVTYKQCIRWIAENDDQNEILTGDPQHPLVTESMVAHLFDVPETIVRQEVVKEINKMNYDRQNRNGARCAVGAPWARHPDEKALIGEKTMKTGLSLVDLAKKIQATQELKEDHIADTRTLKVMPESDGVIALQADIPNRGKIKLPVLKVAHDQIGGRVGIPAKYYDRMLHEAPELLAENVNHWFEANPEKRMLRTLGGNLRAFLSNRYQRIENEEVFAVAGPILMQMQATHGMSIVSCEITETRLYIQATTTRLTTEVKKGDIVQAGVIIRNSEVGHGAVAVQPLIYRLACLNGMVLQDGRFSARHVGVRNERSEDLWADDTKAAQDKAKLLELRDAISAAVDETVFAQRVARMTELSEVRVAAANVPGLTETLAKKIGLNDTEKNGFLASLINGGDLSAWGVINAVTHQAHVAETYDRSFALEELGGKLLELPNTQWRELLTAEA